MRHPAAAAAVEQPGRVQAAKQIGGEPSAVADATGLVAEPVLVVGIAANRPVAEAAVVAVAAVGSAEVLLVAAAGLGVGSNELQFQPRCQGP